MWTAIRNNMMIGLIGLALATPAGAAVLQPFTATYQASHGWIGLGEATFQLERTADDCWRWHGVANPSGLAALFIGQVKDSSKFCVAEDGILLAQHFNYYEEGDAEDSYTLSFDWSTGTVQYNHGEPFAVPRGAIDPFLIQIAARRWLEQADNPADLPAREFTIVDEHEIKQYRLAVSPGKRIKTEAGTFDTLRVARVDEGDEQLVFWVAPRLDYLPVKVEHRQDGDTQIQFVLRNLAQPPQPTDSRPPPQASTSPSE